MFIKKIKTAKGKVFLQIVEGYRNERGGISHKVIEKLGYEDDLNKKHENKGMEWAQIRLKELKSEEIEKPIFISHNNEVNKDTTKKRNFGSLALKPVYSKLGLDLVCKGLQSKIKEASYSLNNILSFLIQSRLIDADSRLSSYIKKDQYIDNFDFSEDQMYKAMEILGSSWEQIKDFVTKKINEKYGLDMNFGHYDGSNFYFEIDQEDTLRRKGVSKENRVEPIVNISMLTDANLIPVDLKIYPGNESEHNYFYQTIEEFKNKYQFNKIIYVADRGLNSGDNIYKAMKSGNGYIYGQAIRGEKYKNWAKLESGYKIKTNSLKEIVYKEKSWIDDEAIIKVTNSEGKKIEVKTKQKQIIFWSKDYSDKQKREREKLISKAKMFINSPKDFTRSKIGDAATFVKFANFNSQGEYIDDIKNTPIIDLEAIKKQEEMDGYFMVVSSELNLPDEAILKAYSEQKGLERNFRVNKTYLKIRPVYVSREKRIKCHVLVCYLTTVILKLIEVKVLKKEIPIEQICDQLKEYEGALIAQDTYFNFKYNEVTDKLAKLSNQNARRETFTLSELKKLFSNY